MYAVGEMFVKTYLKANAIFLSNRRRKFKLLDLQGDTSSLQFPRLVGYRDLAMRKTLRVVGLLTVIMIFVQSKKNTACKINDEKEETIFYFFILKIIHPLESKKHLMT